MKKREIYLPKAGEKRQTEYLSSSGRRKTKKEKFIYHKQASDLSASNRWKIYLPKAGENFTRKPEVYKPLAGNEVFNFYD